MLRSRRSCALVGVLLLAVACATFVVSPWHGPTVLTLSPSHGIDAGDLPGLALLALGLAALHRLTRGSGARSTGSARLAVAAGAAGVLGGLLLAAPFPRPDPPPLVPAGGGTFDGITGHADGLESEPRHHWSYLALTYDGEMLRLYVDGDEVSSRPTTGRILETSDPLWIGGSHPYGEYFHGLIDEVRIYDRALDRHQLRAEMRTSIPDPTGPMTRGLVAAWGFDRGRGRWAADASGAGNRGMLVGPTWTARGRFGHALRFDGAGALVRVPASPSLDFTDAMTLSGWIRPADAGSDWRTILHRQTDAYFLMAGGGVTPSSAWDDARAGLIAAAAACLCLALAAGHARWLDARGSWWPPIALFLAGSAVDAWIATPGTVIGACLVAIWYALTARRRVVTITMAVVAALGAALTAASVAGDADHLAHQGGGAIRSAALGLVLLSVGALVACGRTRTS